MQKVDKREKPFHIQRGDVYMADINIGSHSKNSDGIENNSEQRGVRPVVVTQCNRQNRTATTVVVAIGTSQIKRLDLCNDCCSRYRNQPDQAAGSSVSCTASQD